MQVQYCKQLDTSIGSIDKPSELRMVSAFCYCITYELRILRIYEYTSTNMYMDCTSL